MGRAPQCELESLPLLILPQAGECRASSLHGRTARAAWLGKRGTPARPLPQAGCWARAPLPVPRRAPLPVPRRAGAGPSAPPQPRNPLLASVCSTPSSPSLAITVSFHSLLGGSTNCLQFPVHLVNQQTFTEAPTVCWEPN